MSFFIDTSALFKRYQREKGTEAVTGILEGHSRPLYISSLTIVEILSNLKRLFEVDRITTEELFYRQREFFYKDIVTLGFQILDFTAEDVIRAEELILKRYMKPVDSLQLAIALNMRIDDLTFVSADHKLCKIAVEEGLHSLTP